MANLNKVFLLGNVTRDPELRYIQSGTAVLDLGLAVNRRTKQQDGSWGEEATFLDVTCWGRQAENCAEYLSKGRPVLVEGFLRLDQWQDKKTGEKRSRLRVTAQNVQFLGFGRGGGGGGGGQRRTEPEAAEPAGQDEELTDDDIPF
jgi:single-strand DNA-binding protein